MKQGLKVTLVALLMMVGVFMSNYSFAEVPSYTYTGDVDEQSDETYWYLYLKGSGTLTFTRGCTVDVFLVGGGGAGGNSGRDGGGGGGGGYTKTVTDIAIIGETPYQITIGEGGIPGTVYAGGGGDGGSSSAFGHSASGGKAGNGVSSGNGGSSGGSGGTISIDFGKHNGGNGGSDGNVGVNTIKTYTAVGEGQGTTTRAFGLSNGTLYAGGGGGGGSECNCDTNCGKSTSPGNGGAGGGGNGGAKRKNGTAGTANTGGGGGGGGRNTSSDANYISAGGAGGSGIVIVRGNLCTEHTGGTHENGGICANCGKVYEAHSQSTTISSYTTTATQHTPVYACTYSDCTTTYTGTAAENHSGALPANGGKCSLWISISNI